MKSFNNKIVQIFSFLSFNSVHDEHIESNELLSVEVAEIVVSNDANTKPVEFETAVIFL